MIRITVSLLFVLTASHVFSLTASAQLVPKPAVSLKVDVQGEKTRKTESDPSKGRTKSSYKETRFLQIALGNPNTKELTDVVVKSYIFAKDEESKQIVLMSKGDTKVTLPPMGKQTITTEKAQMGYTGAHLEGKKNASASGTKFEGYGVQIVLGDQVIGELFDPKDFRSKTNLDLFAAASSQPAPPPADQKDKKKDKKDEKK